MRMDGEGRSNGTEYIRVERLGSAGESIRRLYNSSLVYKYPSGT